MRDDLRAEQETIPPWPKSKWDALLHGFLPSQVRYTSKDLSFDQAKDIRIVFVHQLVGGIKEGEVWEFIQTIFDVLVNGKPPKITETHRDELRGSDGGLQTPPETFDPTVANTSLQGIERLVCIERIYTSMSNVVTVCCVAKSNLATLHAKLLGWAKVIVSARRNRDESRNRAIIRFVRGDVEQLQRARTAASCDEALHGK